MKNRKNLLAGAAVGIVAALTAGLLSRSGALDPFERSTFNWRTTFFASVVPDDTEVRLILIDEGSIDRVRTEYDTSWPWPWGLYGRIIDYCESSGARAVLHDAVFVDPPRYQEDVDELTRAIRDSRIYVTGLSPSDTLRSATSWPKRDHPNAFRVEGLGDISPATVNAISAESALFPIPEVFRQLPYAGHVRVEPDPDGLIRRVPALYVLAGQPVPFLALAGYAARPVGPSGRPSSLPMHIRDGELTVGSKRLPLDEAGRVTLRFRLPSTDFGGFLYPNASASEVLRSSLLVEEGKSPTVPSEFLRDRYVILAASAPATYDPKAHAVDPNGIGADIQATFLDNILEDGFLRDPPAAAEVIFLVALALLGGALATASRKAHHLPLTALVCLPFPMVTGFALYPLGLWWPIAAPQLAVTLAWVTGIVYNLTTEGRDRRFIRRAFQQYLSPDVVQRILDDRSSLRLGGEERTLTMLFSDLEGFSGICHDLDAPTITSLLNDYLSAMTGIIFEEGGTLDKYEGDAIIAFWNAPTDQPDHAQRACRAALRCQRRLRELRPELSERAGGKELRMRIGINTGAVVVGNLGSPERFDYTILGDGANLAARLEGANKAFGTYLMVAKETWDRTEGLRGREIARITVVGRPTPVTVVEPLGFVEDSAPAWLERYAEALALVRDGRCGEALEIFASIEEDPVSRAYAERIEAMGDPERESWTGLWSLSEK